MQVVILKLALLHLQVINGIRVPIAHSVVMEMATATIVLLAPVVVMVVDNKFVRLLQLVISGMIRIVLMVVVVAIVMNVVPVQNVVMVNIHRFAI